MSMTRWTGESEPYLNLRQELGRLLEDFGHRGRAVKRARGPWIPRLDVTETPEDFVVEVELPGVDTKNVAVSVIGDTLKIRGRQEETKEHKDTVRHHVERIRGEFERSIILPAPLDPERVSATAKAGVLTLRLAKREEAVPHQIPIRPA